MEKNIVHLQQKNKNIMPNSKQWSSATPGHIVLMLNQSGSMSNSCGTAETPNDAVCVVCRQPGSIADCCRLHSSAFEPRAIC
jgi:hypothetical protein